MNEYNEPSYHSEVDADDEEPHVLLWAVLIGLALTACAFAVVFIGAWLIRLVVT